MYLRSDDNLLISAMREELTRHGFTELRTPAEVDRAMADRQGSLLLMVNSVCGCAAGAARPGVLLSLDHPQRPQRLVTVFAGQDREATERARSYLPGVPPSSPSAALFRDGELVYNLPRHEIEGRTAEEVASILMGAYARTLAE